MWNSNCLTKTSLHVVIRFLSDMHKLIRITSQPPQQCYSRCTINHTKTRTKYKTLSQGHLSLSAKNPQQDKFVPTGHILSQYIMEV